MTKIISDTSTLYTVKEGKEKNLIILPLQVTINQQTYRELEEISSVEFLDLIAKGYIPTSSQPSIGSVLEAIEANQEEELSDITMADGLSGTYQSACMAKNQSKSSITIINSKTLCGPHRYLVDQACKWANEGLNTNEITNRLEPLIDSSISFLIPQDFDYLKRGGRCSRAAASLGGLFKLTIVMMQSEDGTQLEKHHIARTYTKALASIAKTFKEKGVDEKYQISISHATHEKQLEETVQYFKQEFPTTEIAVYDLSPAFITQGGPGCIAVQAILK